MARSASTDSFLAILSNHKGAFQGRYMCYPQGTLIGLHGMPNCFLVRMSHELYHFLIDAEGTKLLFVFHL